MAICIHCEEEYIYLSGAWGIPGDSWSDNPDLCPLCLESGAFPEQTRRSEWGFGSRTHNRGRNYVKRPRRERWRLFLERH